jgi:hypothetical protein
MCPFILEMSDVYPANLSNDQFNDHSSIFTNDPISYLYLLNNVPNRFTTHDNNALEQLVYRYKTQYIEKYINELTPLPDFLKKSFKRGIENEISMNRYSYSNDIIENTLEACKIKDTEIDIESKKRKFDCIYDTPSNTHHDSDTLIDNFLSDDDKYYFNDFEETKFCKKKFTNLKNYFPSFESNDPIVELDKKNELLYVSKKSEAIASLNKTIIQTNEQLNNLIMGKINPDYNMVEELKKLITSTNNEINFWSNKSSENNEINGVFGNLVLHPCISTFISENYNDLLIICNVEQLNELRWNFIIDCIELYPLEFRTNREYKRVLKNLLKLRYSFPIVLEHKRIKTILVTTVDYHLNNNGNFLSSLINIFFPESY